MNSHLVWLSLAVCSVALPGCSAYSNCGDFGIPSHSFELRDPMPPDFGVSLLRRAGIDDYVLFEVDGSGCRTRERGKPTRVSRVTDSQLSRIWSVAQEIGFDALVEAAGPFNHERSLELDMDVLRVRANGLSRRLAVDVEVMPHLAELSTTILDVVAQSDASLGDQTGK